MNAGVTAERVYEAVRYRLMHREFGPGDRLDPAALAEPLAASVTPVRDALHRLTGEGLIETRTGGGFYVPQLDEPALKDLYDWAAELTALALRGWRPALAAAPDATLDSGVDTLADRSAAVFLAIGRRSHNGEHARAIARLNARLHAVRTIEPRVLHGIEEELAGLTAALGRGERGMLGRLNAAYRRRHRGVAAMIVRAAYRGA